MELGFTCIAELLATFVAHQALRLLLRVRGLHVNGRTITLLISAGVDLDLVEGLVLISLQPVDRVLNYGVVMRIQSNVT